VSLQSLGHPITNLRVRDQHGRTLQELDLTRIPVHFGTALAFDRIELHNVLLASLPPTLVRLGTPYVPTSAAGEHTVIGADGIYSTVREAKVGPVPVCYSGYTCWRARFVRIPGSPKLLRIGAEQHV
jgi:2-polyprenyl-6-methoxyphenol hydroxylase-like FAD-dependent oxidoreductase